MADDRQAKIEGLRELADFLEQHPGIEFSDTDARHYDINLYAYADAELEWLDGLSVCDLDVLSAEHPRFVVRRFGALRASVIVDCLPDVLAGPMRREAVA
jgi:hypothetical protein